MLRALAPGAVLRLLPTQVRGAGPRFDGAAVDALLREALRQSAYFDVAADREDGPGDCELQPVIDAPSGQLALAALDPSGLLAALPIAAVTIESSALDTAVDRAAWMARLALGESVSTAPVPAGVLYSASIVSLAATERALGQLALGRTVGVEDLVARARRADPGAPLAWLAESMLALAKGDNEAAERTAARALQLLESRLSPTTQHRLARALLLARAQIVGPTRAADVDRSMLQLAETFARERPHDPHAGYTRALAHIHLGEFAAALTDLDALAVRWPEVPWVGYYRAFALLGLERPAEALRAVEDGARGLPEEALLLPKALALYGVGNTLELDETLTRLGRRDPDGSTWHHDILRIRAALAILDGRRDDAAQLLLDDLQWLHARPTVLAARIDDLTEAGVCLVRLGRAQELATRLDAFQALPVRHRALGAILTYLGGLVGIAVGDTESSDLAIRSLEGAQQDIEAARLRAARANARGRIDDEARELANAIRLADASLDRSDFAHVLDALGRREDAATVRADTRRRLLTVRLRGGMQHPLLAPIRALAFVEPQ